MSKVIGIHFYEEKAEISWCDGDSIVTGAIDMPVDIRKTSILRVDNAFKKAFETISTFLAREAGIEEFSSVLCIPDHYGIEEMTAIFKMAEDCGVDIIRTVTETSALAMHILMEYGVSDRIITGFISGRNIGLSEFDLSKGVLTKTDTYISGIWNSSSLFKTDFCHSYSERMMDRTEAVGIYYAGTMNDCLQFDQVMKTYVSRSDDFINREIEIKMMDSAVIIEGIGYIAGSIEGLPAFRGVSSRDLLSPFGLTLAVGGEMYPVFDEGTVVPAVVETELRRISEPKTSYVEFTLYENKGNKFEKIRIFRIPKQKLEGLYNKLIQVNASVDENKRISLIFHDKDTDREIVVPILEAIDDEEIPVEQEESVEGMLKKLLPIVDSLEYAVKFSQDKDNPYYQGIVQSYTKAVGILSDSGISQITGEGEPFDYNLHNAVAQVSDPDLPENTVKQVMQTGYIYKGKVLRPASVIVVS